MSSQICMRLAIGLGVLAVPISLALLAGTPTCIDAIGGDEGFELTKAWLWANGDAGYDRMWNDQPAMLMVIVGTAFNLFGPSLICARLIALGFGISLIAVCFLLAERSSGAVAGIVTALALIGAPFVFILSVSIMQEVPALATGLWALWLIQRWSDYRRARYLIASALLLVIALQIKLTAALVIPAIVCEILRSIGRPCSAQSVNSCLNIVAYIGLVILGFLGSCSLLGFDIQTGVMLHFGEAISSPGAMEHRFQPEWLGSHYEVVTAAVLGLGISIGLRDWGRVIAPYALLLTVAFVSAVHRPWWVFYYLHWAIPLAWLAGYGIGGIWKRTVSALQGGIACCRPRIICGIALAALLLSMIIANSTERLVEDIARIRGSDETDMALVSSMRKYADRTHWVYTTSLMYPFHAGLKVMPELAVISYKRFWSGEISNQAIVEKVKKEKPEQLLLRRGLRRDPNNPWQILVENDYSVVYESDDYVLFVLNRVLDE